jgi:hypothetical protein
LVGCNNQNVEVDKSMNGTQSPVNYAMNNKIIKNLSELNFDEKNITGELRMTLDTLQKAFTNGDIQYVGEEDMGAGNKRYKLGFADKNVGPGILISLEPKNNFMPPDEANYSSSVISLEFATQNMENAVSGGIDVEAGKIDIEAMKKSLQDPNIKNGLLKMLIARQNAAAAKSFVGFCEAAPMGGSKLGPSSPSNLTDQKLTDLLRPLIKDAGVLFGGVICDGRDAQNKITSFHIRYYVVSELQKNRDEALKVLNQADEILRSVGSDEAKIKQKLIRKMKAAALLSYIPGRGEQDYKSLPLVEASDCIGGVAASNGKECIETKAVFDFAQKTGKVVEFDFNLSRGGQYTSFIALHGNINDHKIEYEKELIDNLKDKSVGSIGMEYIVQYHNKQMIQNLRDWDATINPDLDVVEKLANLLEPIILQSNMLIWKIDWNRDPLGKDTEENTKTFTITALPIGDMLFPAQDRGPGA